MGWRDAPLVGGASKPAAKASSWRDAPLAPRSTSFGDAPVPVSPIGAGRTTGGSDGIRETPWYDRDILGIASVRDALNVLPAAGGAAGGAIGGAGGAAFGVGFGGIPGAAGGSALGGGAGEAARQQIGDLIGIPKPLTAGQRAKDIGTEAVVQAASEVGGRGVAHGLGRGTLAVLAAPEKQYAQALGATTIANKELSAKVVPELIKRRVSGSREAIKSLAESQIEKTGVALEEALAKVPKGQAADVGAVMDHLQKLKKQYVVPSSTPGANTIVDQTAYNNLGKLQKLVASTQPTFESVRRLRQILDGQVTAGEKTFGRTIAEGSELDATREAANAIRRELAKGAPDVAKINKEFAFWKDVDRVVGATIKRTASQAEPLGQQMAKAAATPAVVGGLALGGPGGAAAGGATMLVLLRKVVQSPQWKTFSAVQKDRLSEAIARGDVQRVGALLGHSGAGLTAAVRNARDDSDQETTGPQ